MELPERKNRPYKFKNLLLTYIEDIAINNKFDVSVKEMNTGEYIINHVTYRKSFNSEDAFIKNKALERVRDFIFKYACDSGNHDVSYTKKELMDIFEITFGDEMYNNETYRITLIKNKELLVHDILMHFVIE